MEISSFRVIKVRVMEISTYRGSNYGDFEL